jgi:hypothetical protein
VLGQTEGRVADHDGDAFDPGPLEIRPGTLGKVRERAEIPMCPEIANRGSGPVDTEVTSSVDPDIGNLKTAVQQGNSPGAVFQRLGEHLEISILPHASGLDPKGPG